MKMAGVLSMGSKYWLSLMLALVCTWGVALASIELESLGLADGLRQSTVLAVAEDHRGYLWIGTEAGIDLYDGYEIAPLVLPSGIPTVLRSRIQGLQSAGEAGMWVATTAGVAFVSHRDGSVMHISHRNAQPQRPDNYIYSSAKFVADCQGQWLVVRDRDIFELSKGKEGLLQTLLLSETPMFGDTSSSSEGPDRDVFAGTVTPRSQGVVAIKDSDGGLWISDHQRLWHKPCGGSDFIGVGDIRQESPLVPVPFSSLVAIQSGGVLWSTRHGLYRLSSQHQMTEVTVNDATSGQALNEWFWALAQDDQERVWALNQHQFGLMTLNRSASGLEPEVWSFRAHQQFEASINDSEAWSPYFQVFSSGDGLTWARVDNGLLVVDAAREALVWQPHQAISAENWMQGQRTRLTPRYQDRFGNVWLMGGLNGLSRYVPSRHRFCQMASPNVSANSVRALELVEIQGERYIWTSWDGGDLSLWHLKDGCRPELIKQFRLMNERISSVHVVRSIEHVGDGVVWLVSGDSLWRGDTMTASLERIDGYVEAGLNEAGGFSFNAQLVYDPSMRQLLYGAKSSMQILQLNTDFQIQSTQKIPSVSERLAKLNQRLDPRMALLSSGRVVVSTERGLAVIEPQSGHIDFHPLWPEGMEGVTGAIRHLAVDELGRLWLGTRVGLYHLDIADDGASMQVLGHWTTFEGLADDMVYAVWPESSTIVWLSSNRGLARVEVTPSGEHQVRTFGLIDGLPTLEFNTAAVVSGMDGYLMFGSIAGMVGFAPTQLKPHPIPPDVVLSDLEVNAESIGIDATSPWVFSHDRNNFTVRYTGIHFASAPENEYAYFLEGLQNEWVTAGNERVARYYGLPPGSYTFWIKAANLDGVWSEPTPLFEATVVPPIWATLPAYVFYVVLLTGLAATYIAAGVRRRQELERLVVERTEDLEKKSSLISEQARALEQALEARTIFFANISHEFRTPLTLIQTAIEQLDPQRTHTQARELAQRYLQRLTRLVDQLLDLSRLRLTGVGTASFPWSVNHIAVITVDGFQYLAQERSIELRYRSQGSFLTQVDQSSVEKILLNLVSNALKYTGKGGLISVSITGGGDQVCISVEDNGPGIALAQQATVFERFERVPSQESMMQEGAGLGLALVKEATAAIGGKIELISDVGQGCCFKVRFPAWMDEGRQVNPPRLTYMSAKRLEMDQALLSQQSKTVNESLEDTSIAPDPSRQSILVVEDNADLRHYLKGLLSEDWRVRTAENGRQALAMACAEEFDVVLADIMMPEMDGLELLQHFRQDLETSHIPFLLLSARHDTETRILGLTLAADDFLTKPFVPEELLLKLRNAVLSRAFLRKAVFRELALGDDPTDAEIAPSTQDYLSARDRRFLERLESWIAVHFMQADLSILEMARALAVNERTLQRKIAALTDLTPTQFITHYRLSRAKEALRAPDLTIQEIAFQVGFNSQQSFARAFKQRFGITPTQMRQGH
jgi:signal transduction histidine kinase/DNA-binding response OmpR family regulator/sugar lactone lactonase YvrE